MGFFDLFRIHWTVDVVFVTAIIFLSLLIVVPGFKKWKVLIRAIIGSFVLTSIVACNYGQEWETAQVNDIHTHYKAGLSHVIKNATISVKIGLRCVNITLKTNPVKYKINNKTVEVINYNERFHWNDVGWLQGRLGFDDTGSLINQDYRAGQWKGLPFPILWIAEYFTIDGEGIRWGRFYRQAGYFTHYLLWLAFSTWIITIFLFKNDLMYAAYFSITTGVVLLLGNIIYATVRNPLQLEIHIGDDVLSFHWGWAFWLNLFIGFLTLCIGSLVWFMYKKFPSRLHHFFNVDIEEFYYSSNSTRTEVVHRSGIWTQESLGEEVLRMGTDEITGRTRLLDNEIKIMKSEIMRISHELQAQKDKIKENTEKIKVNKTLPYLVSNVIELLDVDPQDAAEEEGANVDLDSQRKGKCAVIKTSTRQTYFLPVIGLVDPEQLKPGDLVGVNKDSYLVLETLPAEYDSRVKAMEVDERPTEQYSDIGGLDKQIQELIEAVVLPMTHKERFEALGIQPPKGVLLYGPPGTGKTLLARACAAQTKSTFLKLAGPQLVQMFIGDGAKLVRDAFALAKEKTPAIIFIDELDAIGTKRFDSVKAGDREVQRTMLELLNQLDGFQPNSDIKVIAATNRVDILDPALLRSGRLDRKIEFPPPTEEARARIMQIHSRKMNVSSNVNYEELARCTDDFNGAMCKAVCVEAGMIALRRGATELTHEDYMDAIMEVQAKKKANLNYYA